MNLFLVAILLLTEITPKSIVVHNPTEVARFGVRPVAWLSLILYPVGRIVTYLSMGMLKLLGLKGKSEPYVTEDELKLMLGGAELSGAIEEEEQDMIENVLEIKDTHVREVKTPLVDMVAIDASATLVDFQHLWVTHKGTYSMSVWNLLREFQIRKVHMAVVLNGYGGTVGIATLEHVVEEIVGEIFDENDSEEHQYETVSGFVCEVFGYIPRAGESIKVVLRRDNQDDDDKHDEDGSDHQDLKERHQIYRLEVG
ncbi:hypothetical protein SLEP1_g58499 [Rubroshorea leprosula]|uniref:CNNM transmembrane domain-containing protein n=1 Tax=Rubroshorea leprosula TaxID=152421 RepID=A0AAV5MPG8_9ROSI|nr:hypothetical protein SLEP1_g58499 [Rubroshorea leprosula]